MFYYQHLHDINNNNKTIIDYQRKLDPLIMEYNNINISKINKRKIFGNIIVVCVLLEN